MQVFCKLYANMQKKVSRSNIIALSVLLLSIILAVIIWSASKNYHDSLSQKKFESAADEHIYKIEKHMLTYESVLKSGAAFFYGSEHIKHKEWHDFIKAIDIDNNYPGAYGVGIAMMIAPEEVSLVEKNMKEDGFESFAITPSGKRDIYSSILYLEPTDKRNLTAIGYDMYSEPVRRFAMDKAADSAKISISAKVRLVQETEQDAQHGILMYMPLYKKGAKIDSIEQRREALLGFVYSPFRMNELMQSINLDNSLLNFEIYDDKSMTEANLLYKSPKSGSYNTKYKIQKTVTVNNKTWYINICGTKKFQDSANTFFPLLITSAGLLVQFLLLFVILILIKNRHMLKLQANELSKLSQALEQSPNCVVITDLDGNIEYINSRFLALTGYAKDEVIGENPRFLQSGKTDPKLYIEMWENLLDGKTWHGEFINKTKEDVEYIESVNAAPIFQADGTISHYMAIKEDITEKKRIQAQVQYLANFDSLTGLPNRFQLYEHMKYIIGISERNNENFSVIFLDLDYFKEINDNLGHDAGDALLVELSNRFASTLRNADMVSRVGGDEFIFILPNTGAAGAMHLAEKLLKITNTPHIYNGNELLVSASIGIAIYPADGSDQQSLFKNADTAMYEAKQAGRNRYVFFSKDLH
ncbi:MAG TPA: CHASE domain-containing protein [Sulfurimonas sp.]|uniref:sensor domain-containing diguanylate cyclase n=1 Tax=Sulfurimonas sp. TaxID=2022749 RepID=UPI002C1D2E72|nr:CHASE domain-containing protein [Sulfurimonas sp.]HUH43021.1 CHASE domain-containing protein [Sulfurimonas sp.]